ncbi:hypothetical protein ACIHCQ_12280 [Streptomyces sp. NPDC052236]|uniref:hypothetical protein n=1 Tax=Streptomyces sp. NPDC052236 TaxID=3365686 RepID=UPI0037CFC63C
MTVRFRRPARGPGGARALAPTSRGHTVSGPKLTVRQLSDAKSLVFKTPQTYSDSHLTGEGG